MRGRSAAVLVSALTLMVCAALVFVGQWPQSEQVDSPPPHYPFQVSNPNEPGLRLEEQVEMPPKETLLDLYFISRIWSRQCRETVPPEFKDMEQIFKTIMRNPDAYYSHVTKDRRNMLSSWWRNIDRHLSNEAWVKSIDEKKKKYFNNKGKIQTCEEWTARLLQAFGPDFIDNQ